MKKILPSYKEIQQYWPQDVDFSMYKVRMVRKLLKEKQPLWICYTGNMREYYLRLFIRDNILKFKPSTEVFDCEKGPILPFSVGVCYASYKIPCVTRPKGVFGIQLCGGGFLNIRKSIGSRGD